MNSFKHTSAIAEIKGKLFRDEPLVVVNVDHPSPSLVEILSQQKVDIVFFDVRVGKIIDGTFKHEFLQFCRRNTLNIDMAIEIQFSFMHIFNAYNDVK